MAKITSTRMPDVGRVIQALAAKGIGDLEDFLIFVQDFANQMISAMNKTITVEQNLDSETRTVSLMHGVPLKIRIQNAQKIPKHVIATKTVPFANPVDTFAWQITQDASLEVVADFKGTPTTSVDTTLIILF